MSANALKILLPHEDDTRRLANAIALKLAVGDTLLLDGPIGAGKSTFARAIIRARLGRHEDVPSPTFTLVQTYNDPNGDIWHCDLYRLTHPDEILELGLDEALEHAICLIEWPDRLGDDRPTDALSLSFATTSDGHSVDVLPSPSWTARLGDLDA